MQQAQTHHSGKAPAELSTRRHLLLGVSSTLCLPATFTEPAYAAASKVCLVNNSPTAKANQNARIPKAPVGDMFVSRAGQVCFIAGVDEQIIQVIKGCCPQIGGDDALDVDKLLAAGVTTFDTGDMDDGRSELLLGKWLSQHAEQRDKVQVLTKMSVTDIFEMATFNQDYISQELAFKTRDLGSAPDMVQFYWGSWSQPKWMDALKWLADEQAAGQFKHLGLIHWEADELAKVLDAGIKVASVQVPLSLVDRRALVQLLPLCREKGIPIIAQSPLAGGLISKFLMGVREARAPANFDSLRGKYGHLLRDGGLWPWFQQLLRMLENIALKHNVPVSAVATRWVLDQPGVAAVVRPASNLPSVPAPFSFRLDMEDRAALGLLLQEAAYQPSGRVYDYERGLGPFASFPSRAAA